MTVCPGGRAATASLLRSAVGIVLLLLLAGVCAAPAEARKKALIVAFSAYDWKPLPGVTADLRRINVLLAADYRVQVIGDEVVTRPQFDVAWSRFIDDLEQGDDVVVYYSGHAVDVEGKNYLLPSSAPVPRAGEHMDVPIDQLILLDKLVSDIQARNSTFAIFMINACRVNPYAPPPASRVGLAPPVLNASDGDTLAFYSAEFGRVALDAIPGQDDTKGSPFAVALEALYAAGKKKPVMIFFQEVSDRVKELARPAVQRPVIQGMAGTSACLGQCDKKFAQVVFSEVGGQRTAIAPTAIAADETIALGQPATLAGLKRAGNAIYLGKRSQGNCAPGSYSNDLPFGCEFWKAARSVSAGDGKVAPSEISTAIARTDVNIRRSIPNVRDGKGYYDCSVRVLKAGREVKLKGVAELFYAGDSFLWAIIDDAPARTCAVGNK